MSTEMPNTLTAAELAAFTGSEAFYRHALSFGCVYTEGVQYLAEKASAYWLIDAILCPQKFEARLQLMEFQVWTLTVGEDRSASLLCSDGDDQVICRQHIPWTDFPLTSVTLWFANDTLYLPSEH